MTLGTPLDTGDTDDKPAKKKKKKKAAAAKEETSEESPMEESEPEEEVKTNIPSLPPLTLDSKHILTMFYAGLQSDLVYWSSLSMLNLPCNCKQKKGFAVLCPTLWL